MIVYGIKTKTLSSTPVECNCEHCNHSQQLVHVSQRYFHIFWIPVLPLGKKSLIECQHCKKVVNLLIVKFF